MSKNASTTPRKPNAALMKPVQPDEALAKVVGSTPLPRGELTKKLWEYIKAVFDGKSQVTMFEMTKLVSNHIK